MCFPLIPGLGLCLPSTPASGRPGDGGCKEQSVVPLPLGSFSPFPGHSRGPGGAAWSNSARYPVRGHSSTGRAQEERKGAGRDMRAGLDAHAILWHWSYCRVQVFKGFSLFSPSLKSRFFSHPAWMGKNEEIGVHTEFSLFSKEVAGVHLLPACRQAELFTESYQPCILVLCQNIPFYCLLNTILMSPRVLIVSFPTFICILSLCATHFQP